MDFVWLMVVIAAIFIAGVIVGAVFHALFASRYEKAVSEIKALEDRVIGLEKTLVTVAGSKIDAVKKVF